MKFRTLPGTDLQLSALGFGCWAIGGTWWGEDVEDRRSIAAIRSALDHGINWFDTAPLYGHGHADKILVEALQRAGRAPTPETLVNAFDSLQKFNLGGFAVDFNAQKHTGSQFVEMTILTDNGGVIH